MADDPADARQSDPWAAESVAGLADATGTEDDEAPLRFDRQRCFFTRCRALGLSHLVGTVPVGAPRLRRQGVVERTVGEQVGAVPSRLPPAHPPMAFEDRADAERAPDPQHQQVG
jgi:hypothetical protein